MFKKINILLFFVLLASPAFAVTGDELIEGAKLCTTHLPRYEREYGIPTHLLSAIASTESGRYHEGLQIKVPWPWTINAEGKGYFFNSKEEAIEAVHKLHARGIQSIDVGCMQVNLYHHPEAFASLDQAFEPEYNIAYAAGFLRGLYQEEGSWKRAAADYHSRTPLLGSQYVSQVYTSWYQIIDKLRAARMAVPESSVVAMNDMKQGNDTAPVQAAPVKPMHLASAKKIYQHPHMNSIQVISVDDNQNIGVVQPEVAANTPQISVDNSSTPIVVAEDRVNNGDSGEAHIIRVDSESTVVTKRTGPNFIF